MSDFYYCFSTLRQILERPKPVAKKNENLPSLNFSSRYTSAWTAYKYANITQINKYDFIFLNLLK